MKTAKALFIRILTVATAVMVALMVAEFAIRALSRTNWKLFAAGRKPQSVNEKGVNFPVVKSVNGNVYFEPDIDANLARVGDRNLGDYYYRFFDKDVLKRMKRVVLLGDSIGYGMVRKEDLPKNFSWRLENMLAKDEPAGSGAVVANFSFGSYSTYQEVEAFERHGLAFRPHLVILEFTMNDFTSFLFSDRHPYYTTRKGVFVVDTGEYVIPLSLPIPNRLNESLCKHSFLARFLNVRLDRILSGMKYKPGRSQYNVSRDEVFRSLDRLLDLSDKYGFNVLIVFFPMTDKPFAERSRNEYPYSDVDRYAAERGIPVFDLIAGMRDQDYRAVRSDPNGHLNEYGHKVVAEKLYVYLKTHPRLVKANPAPVE